MKCLFYLTHESPELTIPKGKGKLISSWIKISFEFEDKRLIFFSPHHTHGLKSSISSIFYLLCYISTRVYSKFNTRKNCLKTSDLLRFEKMNLMFFFLPRSL